MYTKTKKHQKVNPRSWCLSQFIILRVPPKGIFFIFVPSFSSFLSLSLQQGSRMSPAKSNMMESLINSRRIVLLNLKSCGGGGDFTLDDKLFIQSLFHILFP
jgi:hypothetical protein